MAATSAIFSIEVIAAEVIAAVASSIKETTATVSVQMNTNGGTVSLAARTTSAYGAGDQTIIKTGSGSVWSGGVDVSKAGTATFYLENLQPGILHYIGIVHTYTWSDGTDNFFTDSDVYGSLSFTTLSFPQEQLAPYQVTPYPNRFNFRDIPFTYDLSYGVGGEQPMTFSVNKLPPGGSMDSSGKVTGSFTDLGTTTNVQVTATNTYGSATFPGFTWTVDRLPSIGPDAGAMTRAELFDSTKAYAEREDIDVEKYLPTMLSNAEAMLSRMLKQREMYTKYTSSVIIGEEWHPLPDDYELMRNLQIRYTDGPVTTPGFVTPEIANSRDNWDSQYYTIEADRLRLVPAPTAEGTIDMTYQQRIPALVEDTDTNWLSKRWPDIYRKAMMVEVSIFTKDMPAAQMWTEMVASALDSAHIRDDDGRWSGPGRTVQIEGQL